jgi:hypothetical protein
MKRSATPETIRQQFTETMQQALAHVDSVRDLLERERLAVANELDAAAALRRAAERDGAQIVNAYLDERRAQLIAHTRHDVILALAVKHLMAGAAPNEVARWLDADAALMRHADRLVHRHTADRTVPPGPHNATLQYSTAGRGGTVHYKDDRTTFTMWWEFATEPAIAIIGVPDRAAWERTTGLAPEERDATLTWIAARALHDQVSGAGVFRIADAHITLYGA